MLHSLTQEELDQKVKQHVDYLEWLSLKKAYDLSEQGQFEKYGFVDLNQPFVLFSDEQVQRLCYLDSQSPTYISLTGFNLSDCSLFGKNLKFANLCELRSSLDQVDKFVDRETCGALFRNVDFCFTELGFTTINRGCFEACNFSNSKLYGSSISFSSLVGANFCHANLEDLVCDMSNFRDADFRDARFDGAHLHRSDFQGAKFDHQLIWAHSIAHSTFSQSALPWLMLRPDWAREQSDVHISEE